MTTLTLRYFFRQTFKHIIKERRRRPSFKATLSKATSMSAVRRRFSTTFRGAEVGLNRSLAENKAEDQRSNSPPSVELKAEPKHTHQDKARKGVKKGGQKFRTDMIKRIDGGGLGLVNPMGWYDASRANTPEGAPSGQLGPGILDQPPADVPPEEAVVFSESPPPINQE
jgi:hypothetical protein